MSNNKPEMDPTESGLENLDKVRELLFGAQLGAVESKISSAEKQLGQELKSLNTQTQNNLEALEKFTREELDNLNERLSEERTRREDQDDDLESALEKTAKDFDRQISALEDKLNSTAKSLREQTHDSIKELREQTQKQIESVQEFIKATDARLSEERVHRNQLAGLFRDIASQLDGESLSGVQEVVSNSSKAGTSAKKTEAKPAKGDKAE